ncbi:LamB/YcsF family protein [Algoriphagus sp. CAU 1675]|uniref:LamB/YcsF family protein n=1 Tax=Algoriphagus sp. CAU 1675 TaxID=3032597 RepID=UPI0023DB95EF|nr:LamB/YcsF family protein [Algoriphagus sp. CAU 1675]MDF2157634.1 LamB/YcsF family protein [Algoriphagus sp. CAU 1675]
MVNSETNLQINCDLGEGIAHEENILPFIDAASVACGGHFGDRDSVHQTLSLCDEYHINAGAHPSYPDRENFGRKSLELPTALLLNSIQEQIALFMEEAEKLGLAIDHIKFHGALYNDAAANPGLAETLCQFLRLNYPNVPVLVPPHSEMEKAAKNQGLKTRLEIFGDRAYTDDFRLLARSEPGSLLTTLEEVQNQLSPLFESSVLISTEGNKLPVQADTICFHGDNPGILTFLPEIRKKWWT